MTIYKQINETKNAAGLPVFTSEPQFILLYDETEPTTRPALRVLPVDDPDRRPSA